MVVFEVLARKLKKMKRSEITELYLGLVRAAISIKFVDTSQQKTAFLISLSRLLATSTREGRGNTKHKIMGSTYKPSQVQCLKIFSQLMAVFLCPL